MPSSAALRHGDERRTFRSEGKAELTSDQHGCWQSTASGSMAHQGTATAGQDNALSSEAKAQNCCASHGYGIAQSRCYSGAMAKLCGDRLCYGKPPQSEPKRRSSWAGRVVAMICDATAQHRSDCTDPQRNSLDRHSDGGAERASDQQWQREASSAANSNAGHSAATAVNRMAETGAAEALIGSVMTAEQGNGIEVRGMNS